MRVSGIWLLVFGDADWVLEMEWCCALVFKAGKGIKRYIIIECQ